MIQAMLKRNAKVRCYELRKRIFRLQGKGQGWELELESLRAALAKAMKEAR